MKISSIKHKMKAFLTKEELKSVAPLQTIQAISSSDDEIITILIDENAALIASYLQGRYDTEAIFATENKARSVLIVKYLKDLVIYDLYTRQGQGHVGESIELRYKEAMQWLKKVSLGELSPPDLPIKTDAVHAPFWESGRKYRHRF